MRIPKTSVRTSWRADWLIEFGIALVVLAFLTREIIFAVIGAGILLVLASLGLLFLRRLGVLRGQLYVAARLTRARVILGDSIEGDLTIRNESRLAARILAVTPVVEKGLSFKLLSPSNQLLRPDATSSSKFEITSPKSGRFQIYGFTLTFTEARGLFTGEVNYVQGDCVEVYPGVGTKAPLTPLRLYGGSPDIFRKAPTGMDYAGIRQYALGDDYHKVEWKATARLRTLVVKELHPETQARFQILIDAGRIMHEQAYVGTRLDEALAIAQLLVESLTAWGNRVGILVYNETEILRVMKPSAPEEQRANLRELGLSFREAAGKEIAPTSMVSGTPWRGELDLSNGGRLVAFLRSLRLKLRLGYRKTGIYKALAKVASMAPESRSIVLTDLETSIERLSEAASAQRERDLIIVAQIGAAWRLMGSLEQAYAEYQANSRTLHRLQRLGLTVFDLRPERLVESVAQHISKRTATVQP